jgi:hypothetical protein
MLMTRKKKYIEWTGRLSFFSFHILKQRRLSREMANFWLKKSNSYQCAYDFLNHTKINLDEEIVPLMKKWFALYSPSWSATVSQTLLKHWVCSRSESEFW